MMILILVAEIAVGVTIYAMKDTAKTETKKFLSDTIKDYYAAPNQQDGVTLLWNNIMVQVSFNINKLSLFFYSIPGLFFRWNAAESRDIGTLILPTSGRQ